MSNGLSNTLLVGGSIALVLFGYKGCEYHQESLDVDRKIEQYTGMAGGVTKASSLDTTEITMETLLGDAEKNAQKWKGENSAILYDIDIYSMDNIIDLIHDAKLRAREIGLLDNAYKVGYLSPEAPEWVVATYANLKSNKKDDKKYNRLVSSELAGTIQTVYESFNDAVSGEVTVTGKDVSTNNYALVSILENAADASFWSPSDASYTKMNNAWSHAYFSLVYSGMGRLDKAVENLEKTATILSEFSDDVDLAVVRSDLPTYEMKHLKSAVKSAINEFKELDAMPLEDKYTQGWWGMVQKKSESLGSSDCNIGELSSYFGGKLGTKSIINWSLAGVLGLGLLGLGGALRQ